MGCSCLFCGASGPAGATCRTCLVPIALPELEARPRPECPRCSGRLVAIGLAPETAAQPTAHACKGCRGMFIPPRAWSTLVKRPDLVEAIDRHLVPGDTSGGALVALVRCPACGAQMERVRFAATSSVIVDVCAQHGLWLDAGELGASIRYAAHRARLGVEGSVREAEAGERQAAIERAARDPALLREALEIERARAPRPAAPSPSPSLRTQIKRVAFVLGVLALLVRVGLFVYAKNSSQGDEARRAAQGANKALGGL